MDQEAVPGCSKSPSCLEPNSRHEIEHAVSELFDFLNVSEGKHFNRHSVAEKMERSTRRQSSKPFELFYNKASENNAQFVDKYQAIKCQNINEVDPFVRFLVRVRDDSNLSSSLKLSEKLAPSTPSSSSPSLVSMRHRNGVTGKTARPKSSSVLKSLTFESSSSRSYNNTLTPTNSKKAMNLSSPESNHHFAGAEGEELEFLSSKKEITKPKLYHQRQRAMLSTPSSSCLTPSASYDGVDTSPTVSSAGVHRSNKRTPNFMSRDFQPCDWPKENDCFGRLGELSVVEQEQALLRDLLYVLIGIDSKYIRLVRSEESSRYKLQLDPSADHFLCATTTRIVKIAYSYSAIVTFLESRCYGLVNQALVAAMREHLHEYDTTVARMEDMLFRRDLFLQKMFYILLPFFSTFSLLRDLSTKLYKNKCMGGAVLTILHEKTKSIQGMDNNALELCLTLTRRACAPYFNILRTWIFYGEIDDPRREFYIEDVHQGEADEVDKRDAGKSFNVGGFAWDSDEEMEDDFGKLNDNYWDSRYRVNTSKLPIFLKRHELIIYKTGKYVSIINKVKQLFTQSGKVSCSSTSGAASDMSGSSSSNSSLAGGAASSVGRTPRPRSLEYSFDESSYLAPIEAAYEEASSELLHILIHQSQLVETLNAVRHYLLLSQGDFLVHFISFASKDLCKRTDSVVQHRLDSMMGMATGISVVPGDRAFLKDDPHVQFVGKSFLKQIWQIMRPGEDVPGGPSPSSSVLWKCEVDDDDEEEDEETGVQVVSLNRSIVGSVIEGQGRGWRGERDMVDSLDEVKQRRLYTDSGRDKKTSALPEWSKTMSQSAAPAVCTSNSRLYCYESLGLTFDVPFPLSLIFSPKSKICYQLLFRYVFLCRYAAMELEETWKDNVLNTHLKRTANAHDSSFATFKALHKRAFALRYKMIAFVRNFHYFYAFEVIDPYFVSFIHNIQRKGSSLDSVIECHEKFLEHCFSSCFLNNLSITSIIIKVFTLCIELSHALKEPIESEDQASCFFNGNTIKLEESREQQIVSHAETSYNNLIDQLLSKIYADNANELFPFVVRLDYNHFYWNTLNLN